MLCKRQGACISAFVRGLRDIDPEPNLLRLTIYEQGCGLCGTSAGACILEPTQNELYAELHGAAFYVQN